MPLNETKTKKTPEAGLEIDLEIEKDHRPAILKSERMNLYENLGPLFDKKTRRCVGLRVFCPAYVQDPSVKLTDTDSEAKPASDASGGDGETQDASATNQGPTQTAGKKKEEKKTPGIEDVDLQWEPGLADGPTSARLAVVDYDGDSNTLNQPARWCEKKWAFLDDEKEPLTAWNFTDEDCNQLGAKIVVNKQFHQVNTWATVQRVIEFYEDPWVLGRPVPWAFEGNRLILVPHAGYGENAYYDRASKSLQLYYYGDPDEPKFTCLSHDILAHETGHAILDGIRPYYHEHSSPQTTAFHEFVADLTAVLTAFRDNSLRRFEARLGDPQAARLIADLAHEFGKSVKGRPYLRSAHSSRKMSDLRDDDTPHRMSQVLTGALFDILVGMTRHYLHRVYPKSKTKTASPKKAFWWAADRIRRIALQPLDYLPPVDVQFIDYARAVMRCYNHTNPGDPQGYRDLISAVFHERGLCCLSELDHQEGRCGLDPESLPYKLLHHDFDRLTSSPTAAYYFLHDNRKTLRIPVEQDLEVADLYETRKWDVGRQRLPREVVLEYVWKEPIELGEERFGPLRGQTVHLLCGGTLLFDGEGNLVSWARKPGTSVAQDAEEGERRKRQLLDHVARQARRGVLGLVDDAEADELGRLGPPVMARLREGIVHLEVASPFRSDDVEPFGEADEFEQVGRESWATSF